MHGDQGCSRRRQLLQALAGAGAAALAGCSDAREGTDDTADTDVESTSKPDGEPTPTEESALQALDADHLVGAHYYAWYGTPGGAYETWTDESPSEPVLGEYNAQDPGVMDQHVAWCLEHGITWLNCSWWAPGRYDDETLREHLPRADRFEDIQFSILYETLGRFEGGPPFDADTVLERFASDLEYLDEAFFQWDNYLHLDGRPVLYVYVAGTLTGDVAAMYEEATDDAGVDPYLLIDVTNWGALDSVAAFEVADGATIYNPYEDREDIEEVFHDRYESGLESLRLACEYAGVDFFAPILPGYDDTEIVHDDRDPGAVLSASPERYERACDQLRPHLDAAEGVLVTSFNEWFEDTQIEPSEAYGTDYLELTADRLATGDPEPFEPAGTVVELAWETTVRAHDRPGAPSTDTRLLAFDCYELVVFDADGEAVVSYDVGARDAEPTFVLGVHGRESRNGETARWFGGYAGSTVVLTGADAVGGIELDGLAVDDMELIVTVGEQSASVTLDGDERARYQVEV